MDMRVRASVAREAEAIHMAALWDQSLPSGAIRLGAGFVILRS